MINWYVRGGKRLFDLSVAGAGFLLFALPCAWIGWRLRGEIGSPVLFRQARVGRGGRLFTILKFRTMDETGRVSSLFCQRLRERALDELPQLLNILRGDMSFVGPRPLIPEELTELEKLPRGLDRLSAPPGLTGLAQLESDKVPALPERLQKDLSYIDRCSFGLDVKILARSVLITLRAAWEKPGHKT